MVSACTVEVGATSFRSCWGGMDDPTAVHHRSGGATIARWKALSDPIANRLVGSITAGITRSITRDTESSLGDLIADAQLAATSGAGDGAAVMALMNPGGVRADLTYPSSPAGEGDGNVTYGEAFGVQPFGNLLVSMTLTGAQIETVLEQQWTAQTGGTVRFLHLGVSNGLTIRGRPRRRSGTRSIPRRSGSTGPPSTRRRPTGSR